MGTLTKETTELLERYFDAAANLYGIITLSKLLHIYNSQNEPITEEEISEFADTFDLSKKFYYIVSEEEMDDNVEDTKPMDREIVAEYLVMDYGDDELTYYYVKEEQAGKEYYVPKKEKLLRYEEDAYFEKTLSFISLRAFFRNLPGMDKERADMVAENLELDAQLGEGDIGNAMDTLSRFQVKLNDRQMDEFASLFYDMFMDSRLHIHRGHSTREILSI